MGRIVVAVINESSVVPTAAVKAAVADFQTQVTRDFAPAWGTDAQVVFAASRRTAPPGAWWLVILDTSDQAGALGYHDLTSKGLPLGKVFAKSDVDAGLSWTVTATHELLEMLGDPYINLTVFVQTSNSQGRLYAYEVCDACEDDGFAYKIGATLVTDFVFPAWFEPQFAKHPGQMDFGRHVKKPLQLIKGGYIGVFDVGSGSGWQQIFADRAPTYAARPRVGSRRERRRTPADRWQLSA